MTNSSDDQDDDRLDEEGARPSSLISVHKLSKPDRLYDLQLARDLAIANERTMRELGPMPSNGMPVQPKRKPNIPRTKQSSKTLRYEHHEDDP